MKTTLIAPIIGILASSVLLVDDAASSTMIDFDHFDRKSSNAVGNNWAEVERKSKDIRLKKGAVRIKSARKSRPGASLSKSINLVDSPSYNRFTVTFDWTSGKKNDMDDLLYLSWSTGDNAVDLSPSDWGVGMKGKGSGVGVFTINLESPVDKLNLTMWTDANKKKEGFSIDNFEVVAWMPGEYIEPDVPLVPNPLPGSFPLMAAALGGMMYMRRRKSNS